MGNTWQGNKSQKLLLWQNYYINCELTILSLSPAAPPLPNLPPFSHSIALTPLSFYSLTHIILLFIKKLSVTPPPTHTYTNDRVSTGDDFECVFVAIREINVTDDVYCECERCSDIHDYTTSA